ncbi:MAG TPA: GNAT family N-acetyltransferase [Paludibacter sp.]|nr:GNAT family N-acetyltransferase [Paludibacter sp.]
MNIDLQKISIQKVEVSDVDEMILHRINYLTEMQGKRDNLTVEKLKAELQVYFQQGIENGNCIALMAKHNAITVSYGAIILHTVPGDFNCSSYLEGDILNMYTIPEARKQGISTLILKQLIAEAKLRGVTKLALHTSVAGEKLYRSAGFGNPEYPYLELVI